MNGRPARRRFSTRLIGLAIALIALGGCATWTLPTDTGDASLRARAITESTQGVQLSAAILGRQDSIRMLGTDVNAAGMQPVWIEVRNDTTHILWLLRSGTDPDYFSPLEVAWSAHVTFGGATNDRIDEHFDQMAFSNPIPPGETRSGLLFTNPQPVVKLLNVDLLGNKMMIPFTLFLPVPDAADGSMAQRVHQYAHSEVTNTDDLDGLRRALEKLPCCATTSAGEGSGEPLNIILIGTLDDVGAALTRRGFRPVSEPAGPQQELFGRPPGLIVTKRAQAGASANWLRIWRTPISYRGQAVFVAQAGRPVGGRFRADDAGDLRLHPDVDEARNFLVQDFMYSGGLERLAFLSGVGAVTRERPRVLINGARYYTDGFRAALFFGSRALTLSEVDILDWERALREREAEAIRELEGADR